MLSMFKFITKFDVLLGIVIDIWKAEVILYNFLAGVCPLSVTVTLVNLH